MKTSERIELVKIRDNLNSTIRNSFHEPKINLRMKLENLIQDLDNLLVKSELED